LKMFYDEGLMKLKSDQKPSKAWWHSKFPHLKKLKKVEF
jgi:hypothetical protein